MSTDYQPFKTINAADGQPIGRYLVLDASTSPELPSYQIFVYDLDNKQVAIFSERGRPGTEVGVRSEANVIVTNAGGQSFEQKVTRIIPLNFAEKAVDTLLLSSGKPAKELYYDFMDKINEVARESYRPPSGMGGSSAGPSK